MTTWDPDNDNGDSSDRDSMAALGYFHAFKAVNASIGRVFGRLSLGASFEIEDVVLFL